MTPTLAFLLGDRNGIGPEIAAKLLADEDVRRAARIVAIGDREVFELGRRTAGVHFDYRVVADIDPAAPNDGSVRFLDRPTGAPAAADIGTATEPAGREVLDGLAFVVEQHRAGRIDGVVFAPFNKQAMRLGGLGRGDELDYVVERLGFTGNCGELNVLDRLWTSRVTSHVPLREVAGLLTVEGVLDAIALAHDSLAAAGFGRPRLAVAGLNPHAGDGGAFGREEIDVIAPAVERARQRGYAAEGPFPADTVFLRAQAGDYDCVVTMYHDQGQVAMKLMGFGRGVTVMGGIPLPMATAAHGTAYDIAGKGIARPDALRRAFEICVSMAAHRSGKAASAA
jgi:4-hydroxythreonine-4-phosphate dehydrogenase